MNDELYAIEHIKRLRQRFRVMDPNPQLSYMRAGNVYDGGYVMVNDFANVKHAYSCGISQDVTWDVVMAGHGMDIFMYDHTIKEVPLPKTLPQFHFFPTGITGTYSADKPELKTLPQLIRQNGHEQDYNMILKMDIEGAEYDVLQTIDADSLSHFRQIVLEFHNLLDLGLENTIGFALDKLNGLFQLVHIHANNYAKYTVRGGWVMADALEGTYLRRDNYKFTTSTRFFPTAFDSPNTPKLPEIQLGYWG